MHDWFIFVIIYTLFSQYMYMSQTVWIYKLGSLQCGKSLLNLSQTLTDLFIQYIHFSCLIILKFCTEHGSTTAVLCAKYQNDWATENVSVDNEVLRDLDLSQSQILVGI